MTVTHDGHAWTHVGMRIFDHSPLFFGHESALPVAVRVMTNLAFDYLLGGSRKLRLE